MSPASTPGDIPATGILVVEDDADIREMLVETLSPLGYRVVTAADGRQALAWLRCHAPPCLILLDLVMPVMSGWQFLALRRLDAALAAIPVVIASTTSTAEAAGLGADGSLPKPFDVERLLATVAYWCRSHAGSPEAGLAAGVGDRRRPA